MKTLTPPQHQRGDLHLLRKFWHMLNGMLLIGCYSLGVHQSKIIATLSIILAFDLFLEWLRLKSVHVNRAIIRVCRPFMREQEQSKMTTTPQYLLSSLLVI